MFPALKDEFLLALKYWYVFMLTIGSGIAGVKFMDKWDKYSN
jgi:hypothetical protein